MGKKKSLGIDEIIKITTRVMVSLSKGDDLPCVILSLGYLDQHLRTLLSLFFIQGNTTERILDYDGGCLGTFKAKSDIAYTLGLIPPLLFQNLGTLAEIRNKFAHGHDDSLSFDSSEIKILVDGGSIGTDNKPGLVLPRRYTTTYRNSTSISISTDPSELTTTRKRFEACIRFSIHLLCNISLNIGRQTGWEDQIE